MPCCSDLLSDSVIVISHLVECEGVQLAGIDLTFLVENSFICQDIDYLTQNT